jgi:thiamine kinase-like enzyme
MVLTQFDAVKDFLPADWYPTYKTLRQSVETIQSHLPDLGEVIIHADAWAASAIQTNLDQITLIDWETSGLSLAIFELGRCLLECQPCFRTKYKNYPGNCKMQLTACLCFPGSVKSCWVQWLSAVNQTRHVQAMGTASAGMGTA